MTLPEMRQISADLELRFDTERTDASVVRRFVEGHYERILADDDLAYRMAMAAHEFVENAAKYALDRRARLRIERTSEGDGERVALCIENAAEEVHARRLEQQLAEMEAIGDPGAYYRELMRRAAKQRGRSGLGLARIRAEGQMSLSCACDGGGVRLRAEVRVPGRRPA